jgi:hypothetical protein
MLHKFQNVDAAIFDSYDQFAFELDQIATDIQCNGSRSFPPMASEHFLAGFSDSFPA